MVAGRQHPTQQNTKVLPRVLYTLHFGVLLWGGGAGTHTHTALTKKRKKKKKKKKKS